MSTYSASASGIECPNESIQQFKVNSMPAAVDVETLIFGTGEDIEGSRPREVVMAERRGHAPRAKCLGLAISDFR